jgi:MFS transporter, DHA2 family, methylenomycin A resistance protein
VCSTPAARSAALAVAVFGALLASRTTFVHGLRVSLLIAATVAVGAAAASLLLGAGDNTGIQNEGGETR